jgi:pyruvyltransferase
MQLSRRLEKARRFLSWRLAWRGVPLWWHVGRPNFGDDINPSFFRAVAGRPVRFAVNRRGPHILGAGSILEKSTSESVVCGAGFLQPPARAMPRPAAVVAVRGERSLAAAGLPDTTLLGDPLVLLDALVPPVVKRHRHGLVPHVDSVRRWREAVRGRSLLIHPGGDPWKVVEAIASCEVVLSQSLHGLIVADVFERPSVFEAGVGRYRHSKEAYRRAIAEACRRLAGE